MELKQNPFSFYDFLGYFMPGAIFIYGLMAFYSNSGNFLIDFTNAISFDKRQLYLPFVLLSYATGHFLSFVSSILIEKYTIWLVGYPSKYLLGITSDPFFKFNKVVRGLVCLFLLPVSLMELLLNCFLGWRESVLAPPLDKLLTGLIESKIILLYKTIAGIEKPPKEEVSRSNFFIFVYHYVVENSRNHFSKMQNYVALYGFLRTMTLILVIFFWVLVWNLFLIDYSFCKSAIVLLCLSSINYIFYAAFVKFWRRFTFEVFMALSVIVEETVTEEKSS